MFESATKIKINIKRRQFFTSLVQLTGAALLAPVILNSVARAEEKRRGAKPDAAAAGGTKELSFPLVEPGKDTALAMHYYHSHDEAKNDTQVSKAEKSGMTWDKQTCAGCSFYKKVGMKKIKSDGKELEVGTCTLFPQKLVAAAGICNSWAKKT